MALWYPMYKDKAKKKSIKGCIFRNVSDTSIWNILILAGQALPVKIQLTNDPKMSMLAFGHTTEIRIDGAWVGGNGPPS